ncbi:hypothetical protein [Actinomyces dentalis]|uniref:hypothetical protein n=1 Tax=Actinomyces dentalis TaxID=272548 RepID=UPI00041F1F1F|nr:hypothetical protein [Actinomyces dentalis]
MIRRIVSVIATILGLVVIALAVCSATIWRPSATVQATLTQTPDQHYVLTEPGVLGLVDPSVTITATAEGQPVFLAVAYAVDAKAWLADDPYLSVTGLTDWNTLSATPVTERCETVDPASAAPTQTASPGADATAATRAPTGAATDGATADSTGSGGACTTLADSNADPSQADLWLKTASGQGTVTLDNVVEPGTVLLAATDGSGPAPRITLSWPRAVSTPWLVPGIIAGGLLLLVGVFGLLIDIQMRRADSQRRQRAAERAARLATADSVSTAGLPRVDDPDRPLTRRETREKERAEADGEEWMDPRTGVVYINGVEAPGVPLASESEPDYDSAPRTGYDSDFGYNPAPGSDPAPGPGYDSDFGYDSTPGTGYGPAPDSGYGPAPDSGYGPAASGSAPEAGYGAQPEAGYGAAPWADQPASGPEAGFDDGAAPGAGFGAQFQTDYGAQPDSGYGAAPRADRPAPGPEAGFDEGAAPGAGFGAQFQTDYGAQPDSGYGAMPGSDDPGYGAQPGSGYGPAPDSGYDSAASGSAPEAGYGPQPQTDYGAQPAPETGYGPAPDSGYGSAPDSGYGSAASGSASEAGYGAAPWADQPASGPEAGYGAQPDFGYGAAPGAGDSGYGAQPDSGYGAAPESGFGPQFQTDYGAQPAPEAGYGAQPDFGYGAAPDSGYGPAPWSGQPPSDYLPEPDPGAARGGGVVPGLDERATAAYRASRGLDDTNPLGLVPGPDGAGDDDKENTR